MAHADNIYREWVKQDHLSSLYIVADFDEREPLRLWWFFSDVDIVSPRAGLGDEEVILFLSARHELTIADRLLIDQELTQ